MSEVCHGLKRTNSMGWTIYILFVRVGVDNCQKEKNKTEKANCENRKNCAQLDHQMLAKKYCPVPRECYGPS